MVAFGLIRLNVNTSQVTIVKYIVSGVVKLPASGRIVVLMLACLLIAACTNSKLVLRPFYNSLDDRFEARMLRYGSLSEEQKTAVRDIVDHFHVWHRQTQLPRYELLLLDMSEHFADSDPASPELVSRWSQILNDNISRIGVCNPFYSASEVLAGLTDEQIVEIKEERLNAIETRRAERRADASKQQQTREQRARANVKRIRRYAALAGLTLTDAQARDLRETMLQQKRPSKPFGDVLDEWDAGFFALLDSRGEPDWDTRVTDYIDGRRQAFRNWANETTPHNRALWEDYFFRASNSLSDVQRDFLSGYLRGFATTIRALSKDEPSFKKSEALSYQCKGLDVRS